MHSSHRGASGSARSATASLRMLQAKIILADFNLAVSTQTAKPPNFLAIRYSGKIWRALNLAKWLGTICMNNTKFSSVVAMETTWQYNLYSVGFHSSYFYSIHRSGIRT